jgi:hypothetical protein
MVGDAIKLLAYSVFQIDCKSSGVGFAKSGFSPYRVLFNHLDLEVIPQRFWNLDATVGLLVCFDQRYEQPR